MSNHNTNLTDNEIFRLGMEAGRQQLADHIQHQFEIGKLVEINGELYWLKDAKQNLQDIMDDIESTWNEENGVSRFIMPMKHPYKDIVREAVILADTAEEDMLIAIDDIIV